MRYKQFGNKIIVRIDKGEEIVSAIASLCKQEHIILGWLNGIGATNSATIGLFDTRTKQYITADITGEHEITNLQGNITTKDNELYLHVHITLANNRYQVIGGHLNRAIVSGACEVCIDLIEGSIGREFDPDVGLNLLKI